MKKIILGLCLTAGMTAFASANTISDFYPTDETLEVATSFDQIFFSNGSDDEALREKMCNRYVSTRTYYCDGSFTSVRSESQQVACPVGLEEGELTVLIIKNYPTNCP